MYLIDLTHTSHCHAHTGVQRVARSLYLALLDLVEILPICYDPYAKAWRPLAEEELALLNIPKTISPDHKRGSRWTVLQRYRGYLALLRKSPRQWQERSYDGLIVPEIFSAKVAGAYNELEGVLQGPRIAICHDLLPIELPELAPLKTVEYFPQYLESLQQFDCVVAVSDATRTKLLNYWNSHNVSMFPDVMTLNIGIDGAIKVAEKKELMSTENFMILCVATLEARKNHVNLLKAAELLWGRGVQFKLQLIGMLNQETGLPAKRMIEALQARGHQLEWLGAVSEEELHKAYGRASFSIYPSLAEGYGLPIIESLKFECPCITGTGGALQEVANGGGCITVDVESIDCIADAMLQIMTDRLLYKRLVGESKQRTFKTWAVYAHELLVVVQQYGRVKVASGY